MVRILQFVTILILFLDRHFVFPLFQEMMQMQFAHTLQLLDGLVAVSLFVFEGLDHLGLEFGQVWRFEILVH